MNNTICKTILEQLGGNRFLIMTGSKNVTFAGNTVHMRLIPNSSHTNRMSITLEATDLYTMKFTSFFRGKSTVKVQFNDVYCDQLVPLFEQTTGLRASLGSFGKVPCG